MIKSTIFRSSVVIGSFSLLASLVALFRDRIFASQFGASRILDIYYTAFKIPDFIFNLLILGAVSSAFIPVFIRQYREDESRAWDVSRNFLNISFIAVALSCAIMFVFVRPLASLIAPGFSGADREILISLMRLMLFSPIIFSVSTIIGSMLQALERFWAYAIAPVLYNLGIIIGAIYFVPWARSNGYSEVIGLGLGVLLGALLHLLIQLIAALRVGFRFGKIFKIRDESFRKILKLMVPRTIGLGAYSIDSVVVNAIASTLGVGSIAMLNFANNIQFVPISVVGISAAVAIFPKLSFHASNIEEKGEFKKKLYLAVKGTTLIVIPTAIILAIFSEFIIRLIFGIGLFQGLSIVITAQIAAIYMIGVTAQSLIPIFSRAFYALQNTKTPVMTSIVSILLNIFLAVYFTYILDWGVRGLALAFSIAGNVNLALLWILFSRFTKRV